ncbi:MAG: ABC transporter substrate-binding protein [Bacillota bacterium]|nr:ABC transporter substrate-binding protein [Bacillota bacterium]
MSGARRRWLGLGLAMALLSLTACGTGGGTATAGEKAPIRIGAVFSITGNSSSLGEPERNTVDLYRSQFQEVDGYPIQWIVYDDESDSTKAVQAVKRLIDEDKVAAVICCTTSPNSMAILNAVQDAKVPNISVAASAAIVEPAAERTWIFKTPQNDSLMVDILTDDMKQKGYGRIAFLAFDDAYGQSGFTVFKDIGPQKGLQLVAEEYFQRSDTDVTAQATRLVRSQPDAYLIWAIPPGAVTAQKNLLDVAPGVIVYQSHGVANRTFIELGKEYVEGVLLPAGKLLVVNELPDSDPQKKVLGDYKATYEGKYGAGTANTFGGHALDAMLILQNAIQRALQQGADPQDLAAFRAALRDAIENTKDLVGISGIFSYSPRDHAGLDRRAAVMVTVKNGQWTLAQP